MPKASRVYSVSELVTGLRELLRQTIGVITVQGEIVGYRTPKSNLVYFEVKDESSAMLCFSLAHEVHISLEDGMEVQVIGYPSLFQRRGTFHFRVMEIRPVGAGAIQKALNALKAKLEAEGLFRVERKRPLPKFPESVGLITSPDAAAYTDVLRVLRNRWGGLVVKFVPVPVQGPGAAAQIVRALRNFRKDQADVIILTRGGGSLEDLQAFNDEAVARAVFSAAAPVISGVGHERDWTLADLVADLRAATPSNAAELAVPDRDEVAREIEAMLETIDGDFSHWLETIRASIDGSLIRLLNRAEVQTKAVSQSIQRFAQLEQVLARKFNASGEAIDDSIAKLENGIGRRFDQAAVGLAGQIRLLTGLSPQSALERGYSITRLADGKQVVHSARQVRVGQAITTKVARGTFDSTVTKHDA